MIASIRAGLGDVGAGLEVRALGLVLHEVAEAAGVVDDAPSAERAGDGRTRRRPSESRPVIARPVRVGRQAQSSARSTVSRAAIPRPLHQPGHAVPDQDDDQDPQPGELDCDSPREGGRPPRRRPARRVPVRTPFGHRRREPLVGPSRLVSTSSLQRMKSSVSAAWRPCSPERQRHPDHDPVGAGAPRCARACSSMPCSATCSRPTTVTGRASTPVSSLTAIPVRARP